MIYFDHAATSLPKSKIALEAFLMLQITMLMHQEVVMNHH